MNFDFPFEIVRSKRKTLCLVVNRDGDVIARAPYRISSGTIETFVTEHLQWILEKRRIALAKKARFTVSEDKQEHLKACARALLPQRVAYYANRMGVTPKSVRITSAVSRYGSCSADNRICFSYRVMLLPEEVVDYIVVHELAHIVEHNHSRAFYAVIERELPDFRARKKLLKNLE